MKSIKVSDIHLQTVGVGMDTRIVVRIGIPDGGALRWIDVISVAAPSASIDESLVISHYVHLPHVVSEE